MYYRVQEIKGDQEKFSELVFSLTENKNYPKMEDYLLRKKNLDIRKKFIEGMTVDEFLQYFEDPEKVKFINII